MKEFKQFGLTLLFICLGAALLLSSVNAMTKPKIEAQKQKKELAGLQEVVPEAKNFVPVEKNGKIIYYRAKDANDKTVAYCFKSFAEGYSSTIATIIGMDSSGKILNIKIIDQNETPGLGTRIAEVKQTTTLWDKLKGKEESGSAKPWFQEQFSNKTLNEFNRIDAISGATISSSAVIRSVQAKAKEMLGIIKANE